MNSRVQTKTHVYLFDVLMGSQWDVFVPTDVFLYEHNGTSCTYYWPKRNLNQSNPEEKSHQIIENTVPWQASSFDKDQYPVKN